MTCNRLYAAWTRQAPLGHWTAVQSPRLVSLASAHRAHPLELRNVPPSRLDHCRTEGDQDDAECQEAEIPDQNVRNVLADVVNAEDAMVDDALDQVEEAPSDGQRSHERSG